MNQFPQSVCIGAEGIDRIETSEAETAQRAAAVCIEGESIQEWSLAVDAIVLSFHCSRLAYTSAANGDARNFVEGLAADAAVIWEKAAERLFCERQKRAAEIGQQGT